MAGAVAFASPALAHHSVVTGTSSCDQVTGEWIVDWSVTAIGHKVDQNFEWTYVALTPAGTTIDNPNLTVNGKKDLKSGRPITGKQRVPGTEKSATLTVQARWDNDVQEKPVTSRPVPLEGECVKTPPPGGEESPSPSPSVSTPPVDQPSPSPSVSSPAPSSPAPSSPAPSSPAPSSPAPSTSTPPAGIPEDVPAEPIFSQTCDTITIGVDNTNNKTPFTIDYKTSKGEERNLVVEPGKTGSETFSANDGFTVDVTFTVEYEGKTYTESATIPFEQGEDCTGGGGGGDGELPLTGAAAGGIAGGAAALLAIGGGLFFMARRRKVKFTA
ncbi:MAG TPA: LPXTG cell wall anchor domain-containing protein [Actinoplanes sp.]|nr:LPXTG cell wall anchor domain-containing protein [Actinoplanes sp.]